MYLAHPASGLTAAYLTRKIWNKGLDTKEQALLYSSSIITATLPDFDVFYSIYKNIENHRYYITHKPIFYLGITLGIVFLSFLLSGKRKKFVRAFSFIFFLGTLVHILTDSIAGTMMFLYPLSSKIFTLTSVDPIINTHNNVLAYLATPKLILLELSIILSALYILLAKLRKDVIIFRYASITLALFSIMVINGVTFFILKY